MVSLPLLLHGKFYNIPILLFVGLINLTTGTTPSPVWPTRATPSSSSRLCTSRGPTRAVRSAASRTTRWVSTTRRLAVIQCGTENYTPGYNTAWKTAIDLLLRVHASMRYNVYSIMKPNYPSMTSNRILSTVTCMHTTRRVLTRGVLAEGIGCRERQSAACNATARIVGCA